MPICQNCNSKWTWKETIARMFLIRKIKCPFCKQKQYLSAKARNNLSLLGILPLPLGIPLNSFGAPLLLIILIEVFLFSLVIAYMPLKMELSNENEPMW
ncbi:TIGR04104 family putative zinc finger protein [Pseudalkalibacillus decolorationis]|uniref:TIGR04104 family putative zinc finger protein n=1 Tax=Pseudalkalibacillus decolorationis TaxID=163879 RepID=UPI00214862EB|nr:TIGR04104 family putative zinc finger protein [Pseudalkalibacillus decolorationis]